MQLLHSEPYKHEGTDNMSEINSDCRASGTLKHVQFSQRRRSFRAVGKTAASKIYPTNLIFIHELFALSCSFM